MTPDIIAEEFVDEVDETAEAIALATRLTGLLRRPVAPPPVEFVEQEVEPAEIG